MEVYARYIRKSRAEAGEELAEVLAKHRNALDALAIRLGLVVADSYEEVVSGENIAGRPQVQALLEAVEDGKYAGVLCMDIDRLGRGDMEDQGVILRCFSQARCKIITPDKTYDLSNDTDEELAEMKAFFSRREYKIIRKRMQRGKMATIESGAFVSEAPYGYRNCRIGKVPSLEICEPEAEMVRMAFRMYADGSGPEAIAQALRDHGAVTKDGNPWKRSYIRNLLCNEAYKGMVVYNRHSYRKGGKFQGKSVRDESEWTVVQGLHPAIVEPELWDRVAEIRASKFTGGHYSGAIKHTFTGLITCGRCGRKMQAMGHNKGVPYLMCVEKGCCAAAKQEFVEDAVLDAMRQRLDELRLEEKKSKNSKLDAARREVETLEAAMEKSKAKMARLYDFYEDGSYTREVFLERMAKAEADRRDLDLRMQRAVAAMNLAGAATRRQQISRLESALDGYAAADEAERNALLRTIVADIKYYKEKKTKPRDFRIELELRDVFLS